MTDLTTLEARITAIEKRLDKMDVVGYVYRKDSGLPLADGLPLPLEDDLVSRLLSPQTGKIQTDGPATECLRCQSENFERRGGGMLMGDKKQDVKAEYDEEYSCNDCNYKWQVSWLLDKATD